MKKIFTFIAAMLVAFAANAQVPSTDFAAPGYTFLGGDANLDGNILYDSTNDYLYYDSNQSEKGTATWNIHATNSGMCEISAVVHIGNSTSGHQYKVDIYSGDNLLGSMQELAPSWKGNQNINLSGSVLLPEEGDYTIILNNLTAYSSSIVTGITIMGKGIPSTDFAVPGYTFTAANATLSGNIWYNSTDDYLYYQDKSVCGIASWKVKATRACYVTVTLNNNALTPNGHKYKVYVLDANGEKVDSIAEPGQTSTGTPVLLEGRMKIPAAGLYTIELRNQTGWSSAVIDGITLSADVFSVAGSMNSWNTTANPMELVGEDLYMVEMNVDNGDEFKIVKNGSVWYGSGNVNDLLSDVKMTGDGNIYINLPAPALVKFYWDAANEKVYLNLDPATITCTVAGDNELMGSNWSVTDANNDMTSNGDSTFTLVKNDVVLSAHEYGYKVAYNHSWDVSFGNAGANAALNIAEAGTYDITFTFNWKTKEVSAVAELQPAVVLADGYYLIGNFGGVEGWTVADLTAERKLTQNPENDAEWYIDFTLAVGDEFKVVSIVDNAIAAWYPASPAGNYAIEADHAGTKTIYFKPAGEDHPELNNGWYYGKIYVAPNPLQLNLVEGWNTVCLPYAAEIENVEAYAIQSIDLNAGTISLLEVNDVLSPANAYLINAAAAGEHVATLMGGKVNDPVVVNNFVGNLAAEAAHLAVNGDNDYFILMDNEFHLLAEEATADVAQYKAYISLVKNPSPAPVLRIIANATNIEGIEGNETAVKFIQNGQLFIRKNGVVYDATGAVVR